MDNSLDWQTLHFPVKRALEYKITYVSSEADGSGRRKAHRYRFKGKKMIITLRSAKIEWAAEIFERMFLKDFSGTPTDHGVEREHQLSHGQWVWHRAAIAAMVCCCTHLWSA